MIKENFIKVYLTNNKDEPFSNYDLNSVPVFSDLPYISDKPDSKLVYSGRIKGKSYEKFKFRMWLSDLYSINNITEDFKCLVGVKMK